MANQTGQEVKLEQIWPDLQNGLDRILTNLKQGFPFKQWMKLYAHVYDHCTKGPRSANTNNDKNGSNFVGEELYKQMNEYLRAHSLKLKDQIGNDRIIQKYYKEWDQYTVAMSKLNHIFAYLNRNWIKRQAEDGKEGIYDINTLSLVNWRDHVYVSLKDILKNEILTIIKQDRDGECVDHTLLSNVLKSYLSISTTQLNSWNNQKDQKGLDPKDSNVKYDLYQEGFETDFIDETELYYTIESTSFLSTNGVCDYMKQVERRLIEEVKRVDVYIPKITLDQLIKKCECVLIDRHKENIRSEFTKLLDDDKFDDLKRMYQLLSRVENGCEPLRKVFETHVHKDAISKIEQIANAAINDPKLYLDECIKIYRKYSMILTECFNSDVDFGAALDRAFRRCYNDNQVSKISKSNAKSPELVAKFTDIVLKKGNKNYEEQETESLLNDVMTIFRYLEDKDVFMNIYSKLLAKRLISGVSVSEDLEGSMISKLKSACGYEYISKLQRMFTDLSLSRDLQEKFKNFTESKGRNFGFDMNVLVLTAGSWPLQASNNQFILPTDLQPCASLFNQFYTQQHNGRKLTWLSHLSKGELKMKTSFTPRSGYTLQCSMYQMGVLLQFNLSDKLSMSDLQQATGLDGSSLNSTIKTLLKTKVVAIDAGKNDDSLQSDTIICLNKQFKTPKGRLKVNINVRAESDPSSGKSKTQTEDEETMQTVIEERKILIQAALVRIMKARKKLTHTNLITELVTHVQNRFKPNIPLVKKCIEMLIEKEYLERVTGEKDTYSYVA